MSSDKPKAESQSHEETQSNEEIIDELTKNLNDLSVPGTSATSKSTPPEEQKISPTSATKSNSLQDDLNNSESEETPEKSNDLNDFIDEEALILTNSTLTDEEKLQRRASATALKTQGNTAHKDEKYLDAIQHYSEALRLCPIDNQNDRSVLYCNRAASKIQLQYKKSAIDDCTKAIELNPSYVRAYLRRARLYLECEKLEEALGDYKKILQYDQGNLESLNAIARLPTLIIERNEKMKNEMLDKLKDLGNMILKPFGLSTNNFMVHQDPNSGGYSVNFQQNTN